MAKQLEMMYEGKAKQVFATDDPTLAVIHYKDDATELLDYMLSLMTRILGDLFVYPENMLRSMSMSYGLPNSQHVLLTLIDKGMLRETAYDCVQRCAMRAWQEQKPFRDMLEQDETVTSHLNKEELDECFNLAYHYKHVDEVFKRLGLEK